MFHGDSIESCRIHPMLTARPRKREPVTNSTISRTSTNIYIKKNRPDAIAPSSHHVLYCITTIRAVQRRTLSSIHSAVRPSVCSYVYTINTSIIHITTPHLSSVRSLGFVLYSRICAWETRWKSMYWLLYLFPLAIDVHIVSPSSLSFHIFNIIVLLMVDNRWRWRVMATTHSLLLLWNFRSS